MAAQTLCVGRQPIVDREGQIYGFELLSRQPNVDRAVITNGALSTAKMLASVFSVLSAEAVLGAKFAFVNVNIEALDQGTVELFPPDKVVLEILETVVPDERLVRHCARLKAKGYRIALDDFVYSADWNPVLEVADFVKLDIRAYDLEAFGRQARHLRRPNLRLVAEKVETEREHRACRSLGFDLFQGYFFAHPMTLKTRDVSAQQLSLIQLMNRAKANASLDELEQIIKLDVGLSYRLLCHVNSAGIGMMCKVTSVKHGLALMGQKRIHRWLTLMLAVSGTNASPALTTLAIVRGRLMELLAVRSGLVRSKDEEHKNLAFMIGMFSLLDALLDVPMSAVLQRIRLSPDAERALVERKGPFGPYLSLIEASETNDLSKMVALVRPMRLDHSVVCRLAFEAMAWSESLAI